MISELVNEGIFSDGLIGFTRWEVLQAKVENYQTSYVTKSCINFLKQSMTHELEDLRRRALRSRALVELKSSVLISKSSETSCIDRIVGQSRGARTPRCGKSLIEYGFHNISNIIEFPPLRVLDSYEEKTWTTLLRGNWLPNAESFLVDARDLEFKCRKLRSSLTGGTSTRVDLFIGGKEANTQVIVRQDLVHRSTLDGRQRDRLVHLDRFRCHSHPQARAMLFALIEVLNNDADDTQLQLTAVQSHVRDDPDSQDYAADNAFEDLEANTLLALGFAFVDKDFYSYIIPRAPSRFVMPTSRIVKVAQKVSTSTTLKKRSLQDLDEDSEDEDRYLNASDAEVKLACEVDNNFIKEYLKR